MLVSRSGVRTLSSVSFTLDPCDVCNDTVISSDFHSLLSHFVVVIFGIFSIWKQQKTCFCSQQTLFGSINLAIMRYENEIEQRSRNECRHLNKQPIDDGRRPKISWKKIKFISQRNWQSQTTSHIWISRFANKTNKLRNVSIAQFSSNLIRFLCVCVLAHDCLMAQTRADVVTALLCFFFLSFAFHSTIIIA